MSRYVDIDKPIFVRCVDDRSHEIVTTETTIAELLEDAVGLLPVEDDVRKVVLCKDCKFYDYSRVNVTPYSNWCHCTACGFYAPQRHFCGFGENREVTG